MSYSPTYIVLDAEYLHDHFDTDGNFCYFADGYDREQVVQIGAVKLDAHFHIIDELLLNIHAQEPGHFVPYFERLFGFNPHWLEQQGQPAEQAFSTLATFCNAADTIMTFGNDYLYLNGYSQHYAIPLGIEQERFTNIKPFFLTQRPGEYLRSGNLASVYGIAEKEEALHDALADAVSVARTLTIDNVRQPFLHWLRVAEAA